MRLLAKHKEKFRKTLHAYRGRAVGFRADLIRLPNGKPAQREFLTHPGAVGVLAFDPKGRILLVKQFRYPVGRFTLEIPAGKLSPGENPDLCVRRELEEETGYRAKTLRRLLWYWPTAAFSNEAIHLYVAQELVPTQSNPDDDEFLEVASVSARTLGSMVRCGQIHDSKTIIAYLAWKAGVTSIKS
jgi:ADP-ribose pyrophosphatase